MDFTVKWIIFTLPDLHFQDTGIRITNKGMLLIYIELGKLLERNTLLTIQRFATCQCLGGSCYVLCHLHLLHLRRAQTSREKLLQNLHLYLLTLSLSLHQILVHSHYMTLDQSCPGWSCCHYPWLCYSTWLMVLCSRAYVINMAGGHYSADDIPGI